MTTARKLEIIELVSEELERLNREHASLFLCNIVYGFCKDHKMNAGELDWFYNRLYEIKKVDYRDRKYDKCIIGVKALWESDDIDSRREALNQLRIKFTKTNGGKK